MNFTSPIGPIADAAGDQILTNLYREDFSNRMRVLRPIRAHARRGNRNLLRNSITLLDIKQFFHRAIWRVTARIRDLVPSRAAQNAFRNVHMCASASIWASAETPTLRGQALPSRKAAD